LQEMEPMPSGLGAWRVLAGDYKGTYQENVALDSIYRKEAR
jgi:hypothetical protein